MSSLYPISIRHALDLSQPIELTVDWDSSTEHEASLAAAHAEAIRRFRAHLVSGAFASRFGGSPCGAEVHQATGPNRLRIEFDAYPVEPQSLRLLARAIQYQHCIRDSRAVICFSGQPAAAGGAPGGMFTAADLEQQLTLKAVPFEVHSQWCYKYLTLELTFGDPLPEALVQALDDAVANWSVLGNLGAYASSEELDAFDPDEQMELLLDVPTIGEDFMSWSITQLNVPNQCVTPLLNMLRAGDPTGVWIRQARIQ